MKVFLWLASIALSCALFPLLTSFGMNLEYEYALVAGLLSVVSFPLLALLMPAPEAKKLADRPAWEWAVWSFLAGPALFLLPAMILLWTRWCPCGPGGMRLWMGVLWFPAWLGAHAACLWMLRGRQMGLARWRLAIALVACLAVLATVTGAQLWFSPQKRAVSLLFGFLHGPLYDLWIPLDLGILLTRFAHALVAIALAALIWWVPTRAYKITMGTLAGLAFATLFIAAFFPSVGSGLGRLERLMPKTIAGEGYTLHYRDEGAGPAKEILVLNRDIQFHMSELKSVFGDRATRHLHVFAYPDRNAKKLWFGGGATDVTDVWTPSIHLIAEPGAHGTLRHELVHAMGARIAFFGLGFHPNMAFTEGLAEALAPSERLVSLDDGVAAMITQKRLPSIEALFSPLFWGESGSRAYTAAGSLIRYLIDRYGVNAVLDLYAGGSWASSIKEDRAKVLAAWQEQVQKRFNAERYEMVAESLYRYPGMLADRCPHSKVDLARDRGESFLVRMRQPVGWRPEKNYWRWRTQIDPTDMRAWLNRVDSEIELSLRDGARAKEFAPRWRAILQKGRRWPPKTVEDVESLVLESDLLRVTGQREESLGLLRQALTDLGDRSIGEDLERTIMARLRVERELGERESALWRRYLAGWRASIPSVSRDRETWIFTYLRLRSSSRESLSKATLTKYLFMDPDTSLTPSFIFEWYRMLGKELMGADSYAMAARAWRKAKTSAPPAMRPWADEQGRRAEWWAKQGKLL